MGKFDFKVDQKYKDGFGIIHTIVQVTNGAIVNYPIVTDQERSFTWDGYYQKDTEDSQFNLVELIEDTIVFKVGDYYVTRDNRTVICTRILNDAGSADYEAIEFVEFNNHEIEFSTNKYGKFFDGGNYNNDVVKHLLNVPIDYQPTTATAYATVNASVSDKHDTTAMPRTSADNFVTIIVDTATCEPLNMYFLDGRDADSFVDDLNSIQIGDVKRYKTLQLSEAETYKPFHLTIPTNSQIASSQLSDDNDDEIPF